jgi:hypothetical protein
MKLYLLSQSKVSGWDTFDSMVVSAESEQDARNIHPSKFVTHHKDGKWMGTYRGGKNIGCEYVNPTSDWVNFSDIESVSAEYLGETAKPRGVICASFNAG